MATTSIEAIRRITIQAQERGLDEVAAKLDKVAKAQEGIVDSSTTVTKSSGSTEQAFKKVERSLDANIVAYDKYARSVKAVVDAQAQGLVTQQRSAELIQLAEVRLNNATGAMQRFGKATAGATAGPAQHELVNLSRQLQDVGVGLAGGQSPFTILAQQGPQIADVIATSKASLGDFVSTAVSGAARFLVAWGPLAAAVATVGAAAYSAMKVLEQEREARIATTSGLGRLTGVAPQQVPQLAESGRTPGVSLGAARDGVLEFVRAGATAKETLEAMALATRLATTTGTSLADAYKVLAGVIRDPAAAAKQLDDQYKILDTDQQRMIAQMQATGNSVGAASLVFQSLSGALVSTKDATTGLTDAWAGLVTQVEKAINAMGRAALLRKQMGQGPLAPSMPTGAGRAPDFASGFLGGDKAPTVVNPAAAQASAAAVQAAIASVTAYEAEVVKATTASNQMLITVRDSATAFELQKNVLMATTVETRAAAAEAQKLNELTGGLAATYVQAAAAQQAGNAVRAQAAAQDTQIVAGQQAQLAMGSQLIAAAGMQGAAGAVLTAKLQEEMKIRQEGKDVMAAESQERITNAGAIARQNLAMRDASQAAAMGRQQRNTIETLQTETALIGKNSAVRAGAMSLMQSEQQAREAEAQGLTKVAAAYRFYADAVAAAAAAKARAEEVQTNKLLEVSLQGQLETLQLETQMVGASNANRAEAIALMQSEIQARTAEASGLEEAAALYRKYGDAIAAATGRLERAKEAEEKRKQAVQEAKAADQAAAAAYANTQDAKNQGTFAAGGDKPLSQRGGFTSTRALTFIEYQDRDRKQTIKNAEFLTQMRQAQRSSQQQQLQAASSTIQDQIQALNDQKTATQDNTDALEKETQKRREQLDKQIAKLEKALNPSKPDPYAERNPDYFYRFGTQAFKENDPMQALLASAEAERDGLDAQLEQQKKSVELQQKAIDEQIKGYEAQTKELERAGNLLSAGVDLSAQEVAGIKAIIAAVQGLGDYSRLQAGNEQKTRESMATTAAAYDPTSEFAGTYEQAGERGRLGKSGTEYLRNIGGINVPFVPAYGFQKGQSGFSGFFAGGGYIPPGSWGIAGESGPEVISRKRAVAGPANVTPIGAGRPIVVNQTFVSQGGARELRASRGEIAQRSSSEMRRSLGGR